MSGYAATKFAIVGWNESLRAELIGSGVRVALVCPSTTDTEFFVKAERGKMPAASRLILSVPPERVARAICRSAEDGRYRRIMPPLAAAFIRFKEFAPRLAHAVFRVVSRTLERR
jgi:short-subunit dehydrogenase